MLYMGQVIQALKNVRTIDKETEKIRQGLRSRKLPSDIQEK